MVAEGVTAEGRADMERFMRSDKMTTAMTGMMEMAPAWGAAPDEGHGWDDGDDGFHGWDDGRRASEPRRRTRRATPA